MDYELEGIFVVHHRDGWSYEIKDWPEVPENTCQISYLEEGEVKGQPLVIMKEGVPLLIQALQNWLNTKENK
jgi:hypothetical protein